MSKVAIISGQNRYQNVYQALTLIKTEIEQKIMGKKRIVIKPNLCVANNQLAVTHIEGVKALLDFLRGELNISQDIIIAEGPFSRGGLEECLINYGYKDKLANYSVKFVDLNQDEGKDFEFFYKKSKSIKLKLAKIILDSDFLISICPAKTHDSVITTLAIKNVAVGSIIVPQFPPKIGSYTRALIHGSAYKINKVIANIAKLIPPKLSIIDGTVAMEGNGPTSREAVNFCLVFASLDPVAADSLCSYLMGFNPKNIGYLSYCEQMGLGTSDLAKIAVLGVSDINQYKKQFKPHETYNEQLKWRQESKIAETIKFIKYIIYLIKRIILKLLRLR